jgi:hypothetical protein
VFVGAVHQSLCLLVTGGAIVTREDRTSRVASRSRYPGRGPL